MQLRIERLLSQAGTTLGALFVDDVWQCYTKEPSTRLGGVFIAGESALPAGWYNVQLTPSRRYQRIVPLLVGPPLLLHGGLRMAFGMRILPGNHMLDSDSGIVVGQAQGGRQVHRTRLAYEALFAKLEAAKARSEAIDLRIIDQKEPNDGRKARADAPEIIAGATPDPALPWPISYDAVMLIGPGFEKLTLEPYVCPAGVPTDGWGETDGVTMDMDPWTQPFADKRFCDSLGERVAAVKALVKVELNANQLGALVSLVYNIGIGNFEKSTVLRCVNAGDYTSAARAFGLFNQIRDASGNLVESDGLTARRASEKALFLEPVGDAPAPMPQEIAPETPMAKSPINVASVTTIVATGSGLLSTVGDGADKANTAIGQITTTAQSVRGAATGVKGLLAEFDLTIPECGLGIALVGAVVAWRFRLLQRAAGWA